MVEKKIMSSILKWDMNKFPGSKQKPELTFEMRFARENSNDKGEKLSVQTAELIIFEFKAYMFACW